MGELIIMLYIFAFISLFIIAPIVYIVITLISKFIKFIAEVIEWNINKFKDDF